MNNKLLSIAIIFFCCIFVLAGSAAAQQSSVSFNKKGISVIFKIETSSPDAKKQSFGSVYFTGYDDAEKESRVHRVIGDKTIGTYFGYDLVVESTGETNKFKVSIRPLSINPPEQLRLNDLTASSLPKYPADMIVEDGDTIALDLLVNPQTKVKIVDLIKVTAKKPQADSTLYTTSASGSGASSSNSGFGSGASGGTRTTVNSQSGNKAQDFTLNDIKMRLTSPKLLVNGTPSSLRGSEWNGIIEGSVIYLYVPEKGRFIFSLFPRENFDFQKGALLENNKITFQANGELYELISSAPIVSSNGNWGLWVLNDANYKPDLTFGAASSDHLQYGASDAVEYLLTRKPQPRRSVKSVAAVHSDAKRIYRKWLETDVPYIITDAEKQTFHSLNTDNEREQFIETFWQRRDSTPETKENEFRREYYNRVAFANQNYSYGETEGWQTDRGRIFITNGRPDEVQKNATGETWIYKSETEGIKKFEFIYETKSGDLRLKQ
ncbi:MAG TPA: GWxTD domain-containing protein [Pyrinomonadaceae bacterium]|jgi:GWxTD domain-containing protein